MTTNRNEDRMTMLDAASTLAGAIEDAFVSNGPAYRGANVTDALLMISAALNRIADVLARQDPQEE